MKDFTLTNVSSAEMDERLAAAATSYGVGTRSYNRGAEKKESKRQQAEVTARYHAGALGIGEFVVGPICTCRSFVLAHEVSKHRELRGEWDWRLPEERRSTQFFQEPIR